MLYILGSSSLPENLAEWEGYLVSQKRYFLMSLKYLCNFLVEEEINFYHKLEILNKIQFFIIEIENIKFLLEEVGLSKIDKINKEQLVSILEEKYCFGMDLYSSN